MSNINTYVIREVTGFPILYNIFPQLESATIAQMSPDHWLIRGAQITVWGVRHSNSVKVVTSIAVSSQIPKEFYRCLDKLGTLISPSRNSPSLIQKIPFNWTVDESMAQN
ncbi:hypothetical protein TNCV_4704111 [Trichonephila clavipes]|nr:hypothetical protein TNCV_4704111 [Trichonephila clavipes]